MRHTIAFLAALELASCGQAPDGRYRGEPIYQVHGVAVLGNQTTNLTVARPRAALLWWGAASQDDVPAPPEAMCDPGDYTTVISQSAVSIASEVGLVTSFPASFTV